MTHFTRIENLPSILKYGLYPKANLGELGTAAIINDKLRQQRFSNATSLSVQFPNYRMFYKLRCDLLEQESVPKTHWVVLTLRPAILWEKDCAFYITNAASSGMVMLDIDTRKSVEAFRELFEERDGKPSRAELGISDRFPTDPQAEVLVFDKIEPNYILGCAFNTKYNLEKLRTDFPDILFETKKVRFNSRVDYKHWQEQK